MPKVPKRAALLFCLKVKVTAMLFIVSFLTAPILLSRTGITSALRDDTSSLQNTLSNNSFFNQRSTVRFTTTSVRQLRLMCWIPTSPLNQKTKARALKETWCSRCDKCIFISSISDPSLPSIDINVTESRDYLWAKTKAAFKYIYDNDFANYDWFLKADDDSYLIIENLRHFLSQKFPDDPVYYGAKFKLTVKQGFMSGGAGYVLSREALKRFVTDGLPNGNFCSPYHYGNEDEEIGLCLEKVGVKAGDSRDNEGRHRFLPEPPEFFFKDNENNWFTDYSYYPVGQGKDCCSRSVISFHHVTPSQIRALDYLIYHVNVFDLKKSI